MRLRATHAIVLLALMASQGCSSLTKAVEVPIPPPPSPVPLMVEALASPDPTVRARSAWQLAGAPGPQPEARAALERLRTDPDKAARYAAAWALGHLASGPAALEPGAPASRAAAAETPPKAVQITRPSYPQDAFDAKIEGTVLVEFLIGEAGEVAHVAVRRSIPKLDDAALACVRQWRFEPARIGGRPTAQLAQAPVTFKIY